MIPTTLKDADLAQSCLTQAHGVVVAVSEAPNVLEHHQEALQAAVDLLEQLGAELGIRRFQDAPADPAALSAGAQVVDRKTQSGVP